MFRMESVLCVYGSELFYLSGVAFVCVLFSEKRAKDGIPYDFSTNVFANGCLQHMAQCRNIYFWFCGPFAGKLSE